MNNNENNYLISIKQNIMRIIDARIVRKAVFVKELGYENEFDALDMAAFHIVLYCDCKPVGTARAFCGDDDIYCIERVCVIKEYRGHGIGRVIVSELERFISGIYSGKLKLLSDLDNYEYFEKLGYERSGYPFVTERGVLAAMEKVTEKN